MQLETPLNLPPASTETVELTSFALGIFVFATLLLPIQIWFDRAQDNRVNKLVVDSETWSALTEVQAPKITSNPSVPQLLFRFFASWFANTIFASVVIVLTDSIFDGFRAHSRYHSWPDVFIRASILAVIMMAQSRIRNVFRKRRGLGDIRTPKK